LRERLMTMQKQLEGAQEYIRTQCLNYQSQLNRWLFHI
ncbi:TPA: hypothetical protein ACP5A5_005180, partial [Escherichia coli]